MSRKKQNTKNSDKAIIALIENETKTFYKKDFQAWSSNFIQDERVHWMCVEPEIMLRADGWKDLSKFVGDWMKDNDEPIDYEKANFKIEKIKLSVQENMAFVSFNYSNENKDVAVNKSIESRVLIKENKKWKIISMTSYPNENNRNSSNNIYNYDCKK